MAYPMVHLCIANHIWPWADSAFALGSIAPDMVAEEPGATQAAKDRAHFRGPGRLKALEAWRARARPDAFINAWLLHQYTDLLWEEGPLAAFKGETACSDWYAAYRTQAAALDLWLYRQSTWADAAFYGMCAVPGTSGMRVMGFCAGDLHRYAAESHAWYVRRTASTPQSAAMPAAFGPIGPFIRDVAHRYARWLDA